MYSEKKLTVALLKVQNKNYVSFLDFNCRKPCEKKFD